MTQQAKIIFPVFLVLVLVSVSPIGAVVTAEYYPEPQITFKVAPHPFTSSTVLGAKLGTIIMHSTTGEIHSPAFIDIGTASGAVPVSGRMKECASCPYKQDTQDFYIISVAYPNGLGSAPVLQVLYDNVRPIIEWGAVTVYQTDFHIDIFLVNHNSTNTNVTVGSRPASYFELGTPYALPPNFNPLFRVGAAHSSSTNVGSYTTGGGGVLPSHGSFVSGEGSGGLSGDTNNPMIGTGAYTYDPEDPSSPGLIYGDAPVPPPDPYFEISFDQSSVNFNLSDAYLPDKKKEINKVEIKVFEGVPGNTYGVNIAFTDSGETNSFQLKSSGGGSPIDYNLYFENSSNIVDYGDSIPWNSLALPPSKNEKSLWIGGINSTQVLQRLSGSYSDTIYVNIISTF